MPKTQIIPNEPGNVGSDNVAVGSGALGNVTTGVNNVAVGINSMALLTTGNENSGLGNQTLAMLVAGSENVAVGHQALASQTANGRNTAVGWHSGVNISTGNNNTLLGWGSGGGLTTATGNVLLGRGAGLALTTGSNNIVIGTGAAASGVGVSGEIVIGTVTQTTMKVVGVGLFMTSTAGTFLQPVYVGTNVASTNSVDSFVTINRSVNDTGAGAGVNGHAFSDSSAVSRTGGAVAYNSFDARITVTGAANYNHFGGFQFAPVIGTSGTTTNVFGFASVPETNTGTVTSLMHMWALDTIGTATLGTQYGLRVATLAKGATNWGVYVEGNNSFFNGNVAVATLSGINASGANAAANNTVITAGLSTGNALAGRLVARVGVPGASSSTLQTTAQAFWAYANSARTFFEVGPGYSAPDDRSFEMNVGSVHASPAANRTTYLQIFAPSSVTHRGSAGIYFALEDYAQFWFTGIGNPVTGVVAAFDDFAWANTAEVNVMALAQSGALTIADNMDALSYSVNGTPGIDASGTIMTAFTFEKGILTASTFS